MQESIIPFGPGGLSFIGIYLLSLLLIGWMGRRARTENSMRDFYLAGNGVGFLVLLLTLYATQYSGNTLFGFSGKAYRIGYAWLTSVHFMAAIIVGYLLFAPQLHRISRREGFITPNDYLHHRFKSTGINIVAPMIMIAALSNYLLAQLMAMGRALQGLTTLPPNTAFLWGVVILAVIMLIYETLGGFRAVAWTDVIQGLVLMVGFAVLIVMVFDKYGGLSSATALLLDGEPELRAKVLPPDPFTCRNWFSYVLIFGLGASLYPQAIQRIYAAKSSRVLQVSLAVMVFLPLTTALIAVIVGVVGAAHVPGLEGAQTDRILTIICREVQSETLFGYWLVVVLFAAILGALMSTADSCLLSVSSMATKDLYQRFIHPTASEAHLTRLGKIFSWAMVAVMAWLAIYLNGLQEKPTLVALLDLKFDMLVQLVPGFMIGVHWSRLRAGPVLLGMICGLAMTFTLYFLEGSSATIKNLGIHHGLIGLVINILISVGGSLRAEAKEGRG